MTELQNYYPTNVMFDDWADQLISHFIWAQRRSNDFPKVVVAIDSALALAKYLRKNGFIRTQTKDFQVTNHTLDTYWFGVVNSLERKRSELKEPNWPQYSDLYEIVKEFADKKRSQVFTGLDLDAKVKERVLVHLGISPEPYT
jgi:hypothetical protein